MGARIINPGFQILCSVCSQLDVGVRIRRGGDPKEFVDICGRCLALSLQEATHMNWLSQYVLWKANSKLGKEIQEGKRRDGIQ